MKNEKSDITQKKKWEKPKLYRLSTEDTAGGKERASRSEMTKMKMIGMTMVTYQRGPS